MSLSGLPLFDSLSGDKPNVPPPNAAPVEAKVPEKKKKARKKAKAAAKPEVKPEVKPKAKNEPLTVTAVTKRLKGVVETEFDDVWIKGELSNVRLAASGHVYLTLKDSQSSISGAIFGWGRRKSKFELKDGMEVVCHGRLSVYGPRGSYQILIDKVEPLGAGALQIAFEQLKEKLNREGLFDRGHKRALPRYPKKIAVVTSPTGAAIRDMLNVLRRRAPHIEVVVVPAIVQGDGAPEQIIRGIDLANRHQLGDLIVLARGGGSIEDLWCFNDEKVARAIYDSPLPIITGVGHEIDFTISDFVADMRAPTPSAAAEIITTQWVEVSRAIKNNQERMHLALRRIFENKREYLRLLTARLKSPSDKLREQSQLCDELSLRLDRAVTRRLEMSKAQCQQLAGKLDALSPLKVLERGFSLVREEDGKIVRSSQQINSGQKLELVFADGKTLVQSL